ncbi:MAG: hypothetical protein PVG84_09150, partial [Desulfobacterales bacterium]
MTGLNQTNFTLSCLALHQIGYRQDRFAQTFENFPLFIGKKRKGNVFCLRNLAALRFLLPAPIPIIFTFSLRNASSKSIPHMFKGPFFIAYQPHRIHH